MENNNFVVYEFRPIADGRKYLRYNEGKWTEDDGEYDICFITDDRADAAFCYYVHIPYKENLEWSWVLDGNWGASVSGHPHSNAWHYQIRKGSSGWSEPLRGRDSHPNEKAGRLGMDELCKRNGCANGRGPQFYIGDPYIIQGLLREKESKKVVVFPETFRCIYCGNHDISKLDMRKQQS